MYKVYLAKSNKANPDHIIAVRSLLSKFDVEVVEYTGGVYDNRPLLNSDLLVVLPEISQIKTHPRNFGYTVPIGKGLYDQILVFAEHQADKHDLTPLADFDDDDEFDDGRNDGNYYDDDFEVNNIYIVSDIKGKEVFTSPYMDLAITNRKDFINHGTLEFDKGSEENFEDDLKFHITNSLSTSDKTVVSKSITNYMYLLTRKK